MEVDDSIISTAPNSKDEIRASFEKRFKFGKWELDQHEYFDDRILVELQPIPSAKGRRAVKDQKLLPDEYAAFLSTIYRISWVGKECRPEMCGLSSIMASRLVCKPA